MITYIWKDIENSDGYICHFACISLFRKDQLDSVCTRNGNPIFSIDNIIAILCRKTDDIL